MSSIRVLVYSAAISTSFVLLAHAGDFNGDGVYDCRDIDALTTDVAANLNSTQFDLTSDGITDRNDISAWLTEAGNVNLGAGLSYVYTDANLDGSTDVGDWDGQWAANKFTHSSNWCDGDWYVDGAVDVLDHLMFFSNMFLTPSESLGVGFDGQLVPGNARAIYDPDTGNLFLNTNGQSINGFVIEGPQPTRLYDLDMGLTEHRNAEGEVGLMFWIERYFNGKQQAYGVQAGNVSSFDGAFHLAEFEPGLTEGDFGTLVYGGPRDGFLTSNEPGSVFEVDIEIATVLPGDGNLDGVVDVADFNLWNANKFDSDTEAFWEDGDFNRDGVVDVSDFNLWNAHKFTSSSPGGIAAVPEPHGFLLGVIALLWCGLAQRKR
ncbi:MAG: hypothetical protein AAF497_13635 [Planctomycetota bacterium]